MVRNFYSILLIVALFIGNSVQAQDEYMPIIKNYLSNNLKDFSASDIAELEITDSYFSKSTNTQHVFVNQSYNGIQIFNAQGNFAIKNNKVVYFSNNFQANISQRTNNSNPSLDPITAVNKLAAKLNLNPSGLEVISSSNQEFILSNGSISQNEIPVKLMYQPVGELIQLVYNINIYTLDHKHWWDISVDANNAKILFKNDWVISCTYGVEKHSHTTFEAVDHTIQEQENNFGFLNTTTLVDNASYKVFAIPTVSPADADRQLVSNPANTNASPYGWHDTNGNAGADYTYTRGNNVWAFDSRDSNLGDSPEGTEALIFDFPLDLNQQPVGYIDASVTNLFYLNNMMHDVWYEYGFDEASGNFQKENYNNQGLGEDYVFARGQDGANNGPGNNATFATPPDGNIPTMRMFTWNASGLPQVLSINTSGELAGNYTGSTASFGPSIPSSGITADMILSIDDNSGPSSDELDACDPLVNAADLDNKIAVIKRGECSFAFKVESAEAAGAVAVIIVNNEAGTPIPMGGTPTNPVTIPSIMLSKTDGDAIIAALVDGQTLNVTLKQFGPYIKDGSLDGGIVSHEYGHGISTRLTGGPSNAGCLYACVEVDENGNCIQYTEQMGEGWSDFFALMMTLKPGDSADDRKTIANYALGQDDSGGGLRPAPYSTNTVINPATYNDSNNPNILAPHGVGFVWATMLWDMTWDLIDEYGYDEDLLNGTGGNNIAMQLVIDGLKLQACNPGFVDGRDAILQADMLNNNGDNQCLIWKAFADRGLGYNANQGSSLDRFDQVENFEMPPLSVINCTMGTSSSSLEKAFSIYPNPASRYVNVQSNAAQDDATIAIYDLNGRRVVNQKLANNTTQININGLATGVYVMKINSKNKTQTEKLIVQ
ncbi:T9SS-dependent M36 family metallopeptidase [Mesonia sp. MT50]|uniref:T9SS-dependent M36 family metallopeptidase n=1 Tax=Mesonia profundi TaxID=3070998 RepID=A0ABU0ZYN6_9FLAO|nr:T9SS-dependent M36 family metallopeptidase [Mesonia profundi]MDQ7916582.1 T9SS-dependent M36 family metallopeptidase [Mesonia profundi]